MNVTITEQLALTELRGSDQDAMIRHLSEPDIGRKMLDMPFPFGVDDFNYVLEAAREAKERLGHPKYVAIRHCDGGLLGTITLSELGDQFEDRGIVFHQMFELGFWLAKPSWGQGIMTAAVVRFSRCAFDQWDVKTLFSSVFTTNPASRRVLEKCGFQSLGPPEDRIDLNGERIPCESFVLEPPPF